MDIKSGKLEAYWFPPLDLPPYSKDLGHVRTRLGLREGVTQSEFAEALKVLFSFILLFPRISTFVNHISPLPFPPLTAHGLL